MAAEQGLGPRRPVVELPDLEKLLGPISGGKPGGESLRYDPLFDQVRDARREDPDLPQGVWKTDLKKADWAQVAALCLEALETRTKDLQLAAWLTEAWTHRAGFPGAARGLSLAAGLCESFWEHLHPRPEGDDLEGRLAPLEWLDNHLPRALKVVPVTHPETEDGEVFSWLDWETAAHRARVASREGGSPKEPESGPSQSKFMVSVSLTGSAFYLGLEKQIQGLRKAVEELLELLGERCGDQTPAMPQLRETLEQLHRFVKGVLRQRMEEDDDMADPAEETRSITGQAQAFSSEASNEPVLGAGGPIRSRAEAYRRLSEAADYLARTEPHSPTPHLVRRAVSWGNMTVAELLEELLADNADLKTVFKLLGIPPAGR